MLVFERRFGEPPHVVAVIHAAPLPGAPRFSGDLEAVRARALAEARALVLAGADALIVENFGDAPFFPAHVPAETIAALSVVCSDVRAAVAVPVGVNVLRNDARAAIGIASALGLAFVRVNVHTGARVTDQGILEGAAHETLRARKMLGAERVAVLADVHVKHSAPLGVRSLRDEARETIERGLADVLLVTGEGTGAAPEVEEVREARRAAGHTPLLVASGIDADNAAALLAFADGCIVGSALKEGGDARNVVDVARARHIIAKLKTLTTFEVHRD